MQELRLVPAAVGVWVGALCCLLWGPVWAGGALAVGAGACVLYKEYGQAILVAGLGAASTLGTQLRCVLASRWEQTGHAQGSVVGTISGQPRELASGGYLIRMNVDGYPAAMPVFMEDLPPHAVPGAHVEAIGRVGESTVPGVGTVTINGDIAVHAGPQGMARLADYVRTTFDQAVQAQVGEATRGLIPGMVLGDTSSQSDAEQQMYIDTGLSHLSAVSGSNVAIVTSAAVIATTLLRLGLRYRLAAATAALLLFAGLVGPDPSVLRASVTGLVGLTAVMASTRAEPIHALCFSIIGLVLVDPDLAVHYGFALSVAATAGIVALSPLLYRALAFTQWPDIVVRALAVAIAADIATMPIIALMAGQVTVQAVRDYYTGVAEVAGFDIAELAVQGRADRALASTRRALQLGTDPVAIAAALAYKVGDVAKLQGMRGNPNALALDLGMAPWGVKKTMQIARRWSAAAVSEAVIIVADLDAEVKGNGGVPEFAVENAVRRIAQLA